MGNGGGVAVGGGEGGPHTRRTHLRKLSMLPSRESIPRNSAEASYPDIVSSILLPRTVLPACHRDVLYDNRS